MDASDLVTCEARIVNFASNVSNFPSRLWRFVAILCTRKLVSSNSDDNSARMLRTLPRMEPTLSMGSSIEVASTVKIGDRSSDVDEASDDVDWMMVLLSSMCSDCKGEELLIWFDCKGLSLSTGKFEKALLCLVARFFPIVLTLLPMRGDLHYERRNEDLNYQLLNDVSVCKL